MIVVCTRSALLLNRIYVSLYLSLVSYLYAITYFKDIFAHCHVSAESVACCSTFSTCQCLSISLSICVVVFASLVVVVVVVFFCISVT